MISSLNIVGNGFDLAHCLPTTYQNFTDNCYDKSPSLQKFRSIIENSTLSARNPEELIVEWNDFENVIGHITNDYFSEHMMSFELVGYSKSEEIFEEKLEILYGAYEGIIADFTEYLKGIPFENVQPLHNINPFFNERAHSINFNYTETARIYPCVPNNVYHIHGSLNDQEKIILGYQSRMPRPDFESISSSRYNKRKLRDMLSFKRFLKIHHANIPTEIITAEEELYQKIIDMSNTGKGYDESIDESSYFTQSFQKFSKEKKREFEENVLSNITQIVILGHSLKSDEDIFYYIFENSRNIKNIILFTYDGEPSSQIQAKERLITGFFGDNPCFHSCSFETVSYDC